MQPDMIFEHLLPRMLFQPVEQLYLFLIFMRLVLPSIPYRDILSKLLARYEKCPIMGTISMQKGGVSQ
jgi:hypothetical protein